MPNIQLMKSSTLHGNGHWQHNVPPTLEYVLIQGVNDSVADARRLRKLMGRLPCKLNLIPFNEIEGADFQRPKLDQIERFRRIVADGHHVAPIRFSKGRDIAGRLWPTPNNLRKTGCDASRKCHSKSQFID